MPDPIYLSTLGIRMKYAVEETAGTRPTAASAYIELPGVKAIPSMNPTPDNIDVTTLNETDFRVSIPGLRDLGGALTFNFNLTENLFSVWETLVTAYETAKASGKKVWFLIDYPGLTKGAYFPGAVTSMGVPGAEVNNALEIENAITPIGAPTWAAKPTA